MSFEPSRTKADALKRLGNSLGYEFPLYVGSSVPKELFTAATRLAHVSDDGSMPLRAERVALAAGLNWGPECDSRNTPSGGGATVTLAGLNRLLQAIELLGTTNGGALPPPEPEEEFGSAYRPRDGGIYAEPAALLQNWEALDQSSRAHQELEGTLAAYVSSLGVDARSARSSEPEFDLGWEHNDTFVIVEVKSANEANHRQQVRLGIGQVLEYVALLNDNSPADYRAVLLIGQAPDPVDYLLGAASGVLIIGPEDFVDLSLENLLP